jgi:hypothetical protein
MRSVRDMEWSWEVSCLSGTSSDRWKICSTLSAGASVRRMRRVGRRSMLSSNRSAGASVRRMRRVGRRSRLGECSASALHLRVVLLMSVELSNVWVEERYIVVPTEGCAPLLEDSLEARVRLGTTAATPSELLDSTLKVSDNPLFDSGSVGGSIVHDV